MSDAEESARIYAMLHQRHPPPEWAFFGELANATGSHATNSFDGFALNLWPSKGFVSIGYEVKVSRADFARELANPKKRQPLRDRCHEVYFVVPTGLVKADEVPDGWGLIVAGDGLRRVKMSKQQVPEPWPMGFIAAIARRSCPEAPPSVPDVAWKYAGEEVSKEQLMEIARSTRRETVEQEVLAVIQRAFGRVVTMDTIERLGRELHEMKQVERDVRHCLGIRPEDKVTAATVKAALRTAGGLELRRLAGRAADSLRLGIRTMEVQARLFEGFLDELPERE